jgi:shikimate dehydrogenase
MSILKNNPDQYFVLGNPIGHSKSPQIHRHFAEQTNQSILYDAKLIELGCFVDRVNAMRHTNVGGINITVPFKQQAYDLADKLSPSAALAGAVNTLTFVDGKLFGDNTDGIGLVKDLIVNHSFDFFDKDVLLLGAGGAVRGILEPIIKQQPKSITIANRTEDKASELSRLFCDLFEIKVVQYEAIQTSYDLIINGTSASLQGQLLPIPDCAVSANSYLYDMMYSAVPTVFNKWGANLGAKKTIDGLGMLVEQAAQSFYIWRSIMPETKVLIAGLRSQLS